MTFDTLFKVILRREQPKKVIDENIVIFISLILCHLILKINLMSN